MLAIDRLSYQSRLRYVNTGEKFAFSVITLCLCVAGRSILLSLYIFFTVSLLTVLKGGVPLSRYLSLLAVPLAFLVMNAAVLGLSIRREPLELFSFSLGGWCLTAGRDTVFYALRVFLTAMAGVSCLYFLSLSTPMTDLVVYLRRLGLPGLIAELMLLIYRFIFVLLECAHAIAVSQDARLGNRDFKTSLLSFSALVSSLFVRAVNRSGILYDAMESRCYDGVLDVLSEENPPRRSEILWIALFELSIFLLLFAG